MKRQKEELFAKNCWIKLKEKRMEFRKKLVRAIARRVRHESAPATSESSLPDCLISEEDAELLRYYHHIIYGIEDRHVALMDIRMVNGVLRRVPECWKNKYGKLIATILGEMRENYRLGMKKSLIDFVLRDTTKQETDNEPKKVFLIIKYLQIRKIMINMRIMQNC